MHINLLHIIKCFKAYNLGHCISHTLIIGSHNDNNSIIKLSAWFCTSSSFRIYSLWSLHSHCFRLLPDPSDPFLHFLIIITWSPTSIRFLWPLFSFPHTNYSQLYMHTHSIPHTHLYTFWHVLHNQFHTTLSV